MILCLNNLLYMVMIYYRFHNSILIVQFKRIIIISLASSASRLCNAFPIHCLQKGTILPFIWIWWANTTNLNVPKFLSKITNFYFKHGVYLLVKIIWKKQFSKDLLQGVWNSPITMFQVYKPGKPFKITRFC